MSVIHKSFTLLPPRPDVCQECAVDHLPAEPHNAQSIYYQTKFHIEHGRQPTWADAMAHCDEDVQAAWRAELAKLGVFMLGPANIILPQDSSRGQA